MDHHLSSGAPSPISSSRRSKSSRSPPALFVLIEKGRWKEAGERAKKYPKECKTWQSLARSSSLASSPSTSSVAAVSDSSDSLPQYSPSSSNHFNSSSSISLLASNNISTSSLFTSHSNSTARISNSSDSKQGSAAKCKCKALHHACQRLRRVHTQIQKAFHYVNDHSAFLGINSVSSVNLGTATPTNPSNSHHHHPGTPKSKSSSPGSSSPSSALHNETNDDDIVHMMGGLSFDYDYSTDDNDLYNEDEDEDPWIEACKTILTLIDIHPKAAGERESRHGCLPIHYAAFAMCRTPIPSDPSFNFDSGALANAATAANTTIKSNSSLPNPSQTRQISKRTNGISNPQSCPSTPNSAGISKAYSMNRINTNSSNGSSTGNSAFSAMMGGETPVGFTANVLGTVSPDGKQDVPLSAQELEMAMEAREEELRRQQCQQQDQLLPPEEIGLVATTNNNNVAQTHSSILPHHARPPPITTTAPREVSNGSTCSFASRTSINSTATANFPTSNNSRHNSLPSSFTEKTISYLTSKRYIQNAQKREEYSLRVLNALLDAYPRGVKVDSQGRRLPLHTAVAGRATFHVIQTLVTAYPDAARHRNVDGYLPLHLAAHVGVSCAKVPQALLRVYPDAGVGKNRWERTPLDEALGMAGENGRENQLSLVRCLRRHTDYWTENPGWDRLVGNHGGNPMRIEGEASARRMKDRAGAGTRSHPNGGRVAGTLVDVDDLVVKKNGNNEDEERDLRFKPYGHLGVNHLLFGEGRGNDGAGDGIERAVLVEDDNNVSDDEPHKSTGVPRRSPPNRRNGNTNHSQRRYRNNTRRSYIASIAENSDLKSLIKAVKWEAVVYRIENYPSEASVTLKTMLRGGYRSCVSPLHLACEMKPPIDVVEILVEADEDAASARQKPGGQFPLHVACTWGASADIVGFLIAACPQAAKERDDHGNLPLHCACFSGTSEEVVESLLCTYPKAVKGRNEQGSTPGDISRRLTHANRLEVLDLIEKATFELLKRKRKAESGDLTDIARAALMQSNSQAISPLTQGRRNSPQAHADRAHNAGTLIDKLQNGKDEEDNDLVLWV